MEKIVIKQNLFRHFLLIAGGLLLLLASLFLLLGDFSDSMWIKRFEWVRIPLAVTGVIFFCTGTGYAIYRLWKFHYVLVIDRKGFIDYSTMAAIGFVEWKEVTRIYVRKIPFMDQKLIGVEVRNINRLCKNQPWYKKKLIQANLKSGYPPITITLNSAKEEVDAVCETMKTYLTQSRQQG